MLEFGRETCCNLDRSGALEWLVTNGLGGYASGTVAGLLSRRYHGLLIAALRPPTDRSLLAGKLDETADYDGSLYPLHANRYADGQVKPHGFRHLERFHLEGAIPVWTFALADALLEKRVWMEQGRNTTYVLYTLVRGFSPVALHVDALVHRRDHHHLAPHMHPELQVALGPGGIHVSSPSGPDVRILCDRARAAAMNEWAPEFFLSVENRRGYEALDSELRAAHFDLSLEVGESAAFVLTTEPDPDANGQAAFTRRVAYERSLVPASTLFATSSEIGQLAIAADQFIVSRLLPGGGQGASIIAGYPWFTDWGRDTMICLPGLCLTTGREAVAARILATFAGHVDQGMLPNRFVDEGGTREHNTIDATMWYFEAIRAYHARTGDDDLLAGVFPILEDIVDWHLRGTRYSIHVDPADGLLYGGQEGLQLTWMDAKVGESVPTPRIGKPVEISALWYNALMSMAGFADRLGKPAGRFGNWPAGRGQGLPGSGTRTPVTCTTCWTGRLGMSRTSVRTSSSPSPCTTARSNPIGRSRWWTFVRATC